MQDKYRFTLANYLLESIVATVARQHQKATQQVYGKSEKLQRKNKCQRPRTHTGEQGTRVCPQIECGKKHHAVAKYFGLTPHREQAQQSGAYNSGQQKCQKNGKEAVIKQLTSVIVAIVVPPVIIGNAIHSDAESNAQNGKNATQHHLCFVRAKQLQQILAATSK